ncbi:MAG: cation transporter [Clostridia bacterium]|nr:cation transporter [Clostridia bacterium]
MDPNIRQKKITQTGFIGIAANLILAGFKAAIGLIAGAVSIVLDAVNNLTDALSSVITIVGVKLARKKPDQKHPFGYGRIEYFSAILIAAIILTAGVTSLIESVKKIFDPELPDFSVVSLVIIAVAIGVKIALGTYVKKQGETYRSDALVSSGKDALFDAILSTGTLIGALIAFFFKFSVDGYIGAVISAFIIKAGIEALLESVGSVMGARPEAETTKAIKETVRSIDGVKGAYDLILHDYGPDSAIGSIHVEISDAMTAGELHALTKKIQTAVFEQFRIFLTVGVYAIDEAHNPVREKIHALAMSHEGVIGTHGIYIDDEQKTVSFDTVVTFTVKDRGALCADLAKEVQNILPGYTVSVNFDSDYSD